MAFLDIKTILALTALALFAVAAAISLVMGPGLSSAARAARNSLVVQAAGWVFVVSAEFIWRMPLSVLAVVCASVSSLLMFTALEHWLGPRPGRLFLRVLCALTPLGYALGFASPSFRVVWVNLFLATQFAVMTTAALWQSPKLAEDGWRVLLALCYGPMSVLTLGRGILGGWYPELYPNFLAPHPVNVAAQVSAHISVVLSAVGVLAAWRREVEIQLERQAHTDSLTGLLNRRGWLKHADMVVAQARRHHYSVGILMLDLDHFKQVNDRFGHEAGDRALALLSKCMTTTMRESDVCGRLGGEEFALLLPRVDETSAQALDQRLRALFQTQSGDKLGIMLNFSSGLAFCDLTKPDALKRALMQADASMYQAKANGRGRMCANADVSITIPDELIS